MVNFISPSLGGLTCLARGLKKSGSKLAPFLQPGNELLITTIDSKRGAALLTGTVVQQEHRNWQSNLDLLSLYWFMLESSWLASAEAAGNESIYRLLVNLLRSNEALTSRHSLACVFFIRFLVLCGMLPDLFHDDTTGEMLEGHTVYCRPGFDGLCLESSLKLAGVSSGGLVRINADRLKKWQDLYRKPLLDYHLLDCDSLDTSVLAWFTRLHLESMSSSPLRTAEFLKKQWKLESTREIVMRQ